MYHDIPIVGPRPYHQASSHHHAIRPLGSLGGPAVADNLIEGVPRDMKTLLPGLPEIGVNSLSKVGTVSTTGKSFGGST